MSELAELVQIVGPCNHQQVIVLRGAAADLAGPLVEELRACARPIGPDDDRPDTPLIVILPEGQGSLEVLDSSLLAAEGWVRMTPRPGPEFQAIWVGPDTAPGTIAAATLASAPRIPLPSKDSP